MTVTAGTIHGGGTSAKVKVRATRLDPDPNFISDTNSIAGQYVVEYVDTLSDNPDNLTTDPTGGYPSGAPGMSANATSQTVVANMDIADDAWTNPAETVQYPQGVATANSLCTSYGATLQNCFDEMGSFVATMTETQARAMSHDPNVLYVFSDMQGDPATVQTTPSSDLYSQDEWALDRLDQHSWVGSRSFTYSYANSGAGVNAYMFDSGILAQDPEFTNKVYLDYSAVGGESPSGLHVYHGTETSSTLGGHLAGAAKNVSLHSVKIIDRTGHWYMSGFLKAANWLYKYGKKPLVVNCSLDMRKRGSSWFGLNPGTGPIERAVKRMLGKGFCVVNAAGNESQDSNNVVPADVWEAVAVGATDISDSKATFSNYGSHMDFFGPGTYVEVSRWSLSNGV